MLVAVIDQSTGTYKIKGSFPNEQNRLWPGQFVNVKLKLKVLENAIVVPSVAVQEGANGSYVFTVTPENTVKLTSVTVVQEGERRTVLSSGVTPGDVVVTAGFASLQDGSKVKVEMAAETAAAAPGGENGGAQAPAQARNRDAAQEGGSGGGEHRHRKGQDKSAGQAGAAPAGQDSPKP